MIAVGWAKCNVPDKKNRQSPNIKFAWQTALCPAYIDISFSNQLLSPLPLHDLYFWRMAVIFLKAAHFHLAEGAEALKALNGSAQAIEGCRNGYPAQHGMGPDLNFVKFGAGAG